jgi:phospholysine phosphohistidine inorganic pyrophosphate phosphatase
MASRKRRALLFDMDGVLYDGTLPIPGAREALADVRAANFPHLSVTNTSSCSRRHLAEKLIAFGIAATDSDIFSPRAAAGEWLREHTPGREHDRAPVAALPAQFRE